MKKLPVLILLLVTIFACKDQNTTSDCLEIIPDSPFTLPAEDCAEWLSEDLQISILSIQDSRCPTHVVCVWQGQAVVELLLSKGGNEYTTTLTVEGLCQTACGSNAEILDYYIELFDLQPYPGADPIPFEAYEADLLVRYKD